MKTTNPMIREDVLTKPYEMLEKPMTVAGSINKLLFFSFVALFGAYIAYYQFTLGHYDVLNMFAVMAFIPLLIISLIIGFKPKTTPYLGTIFAFIQGAWVSSFSCFMEKQFDGIVSQAIALTLLVVLVMAIAFKLGLIRATEKFKSIMVVATFSILIFYIISFVAMFFFHASIAYFDMGNANYFSPMAIGLNIIIAIVAALNLILDFDFIENGARQPLPSYMEWYGAFALMVTILWLYIEILRLLSRFNRR